MATYRPATSDSSTASASVVVTYYPDPSAYANIRELIRQSEAVYVVDNTPENDRRYLPDRDCGTLIWLGANMGIGVALNTGVQQAIEAGFEKIFLFDQDTVIPPDYIKNMRSFSAKFKNDDVAIIGPSFVDKNIGTESTFVVIDGWKWRPVKCAHTNKSQPLGADFAITSGSFITKDTYLRLGPFDEDFFIDHVDSEYCLRAKAKGYRTLINCEAAISHSIGSRKLRRLFGVTIKPNNHSPERRYYIARNGVLIARRYRSIGTGLLTLNAARLIHEILSVVFYEQDKILKIYGLLLGVTDGARNKSGPCPHPTLTRSSSAPVTRATG